MTEAAARGRALRVLPGQRGPRRAGLPGQLLHGQAEGRGQGVPAHRHRRLHPLGFTSAIVLGPLTRHPRRALHRPGAARTTGAMGCGSEPSSPTTAPNTWPRDSGTTWSAKDLTHVRIPPRSPNHNSVCERFHGHHPPRVLASGLPPPALHLHPPAPGRSRCLAHDLQPPPAQNHGDYMRGRTPQERPRQLQAKTRQHDHDHQAPEVHLSPRLSVRKP